MDELERLIKVVKRLRDPQTGCPWDSVQTNRSIRRYLVEEAGEYLDALEEENWDEVREELGDLLLQVVLNAQICQDEGRFDLQDIARDEADKMIRRHPHVFGTSSAHTEEERRRQWDAIKNAEPGNLTRKSALDGVPRSMPALARAQKTLSKIDRAGLPAPDFGELRGELTAAQSSQDTGDFSRHLGRLMFGLVALCRQHDVQAEEVLQDAIRAFHRSFRENEDDT
ncbi:MAG: nucleoside triphosphate pyrophosphohydrolase, partial [Victivallales bacterium]|nr:nucleoside triphosphate pyrophosphohydrolase [Victivallales bacterium]